MIRETKCVGVESCNWALAVVDGFLQLNPNLIWPSQKKRLAAFITDVSPACCAHPCCHGNHKPKM